MIARDLDRLLEGFAYGRISRRQFMTRGAMLGVSVASLSALLEACAQSTTPAPATAAAQASSAAATGAPASAAGSVAPSASLGPRTGGTLIHSSSQVPNGGFDSTKHWDWFALTVGLSCFDPLLKNDPSVIPVVVMPWLSSMPDVSADATVYTFHLNPAAKFQTGDPVTATDAKFTLERLIDPNFGAETASLYHPIPYAGKDAFINQSAKDVSGIKVVDDHTLEVTLDRPESSFLYVIAYPSSGILNKKVVEQMGNKAYDLLPTGGSGPFKLVSAKQDSGLVMERNPNYWNPPFPYVDRVEWNWPVDPNLAVLRMENGQQDTMLDSAPSGAITRLRDDAQHSHQLVIGEMNQIQTISLNLTHPAMQDVRVRQAMAMAVDKERIVQVLQGAGTAATGGVLTPGLGDLYTEGLAYPFDPQGAKQLLAAAGFADGFDLVYWGGNITPFKEQNSVIAQNFSDLGIRLDLRLRDFTTIVNEWISHPQAIIDFQCEIGWPLGGYMMDSTFSQLAIDSNCCNPSGYSDPTLEGYLKDGHTAASQADAVAVYKKADEYITKEKIIAIPTVYQKKADVVSARVRDSFFTCTSPSGDFKYFYELWLNA